MAYRRLVYAIGTRGPEDTEAIYVRGVEMMTACTDEEILAHYGVAPNADATSSLDEHGIVATGSDHDSGDVSVYHDFNDEAEHSSHQRVIGDTSDDVSLPGTNGLL